MAYCTDPRNHRRWWWSGPDRFEWFDYRRKRIVPTRTATVHCMKCHNHWGTTNKEFVATLPVQRPPCDPHDWFYYSETKRICNMCGTIQTRPDPTEPLGGETL